MNILLFAPFRLTENGGITTIGWNLQRGLRDLGHSAIVLTAGDGDTVTMTNQRGSGDEYEIYMRRMIIPHAPFKGFVAFWLYLPMTVCSLARFLRRERIEIVHIHFTTPSALYLALMRPFARWRLVLTFHGSDINNLESRSLLYRFILRLILKCADRIMLCSASLRSKLLAVSSDYAIKSSVVPNANPLRLPMVKTHPWNGAMPDDFALSVGSLIHRKGFDILFRALLKAEQLNCPIKLLVVGGGPDRERLEALANELGISSQVYFAGEIDQQSIAAFYTRCRYFVLATRAEGMPLVVIEAMSFGKAVISTSVDGIPEVIRDGETGLLVPPEDVDGLATAMIKLQRDPALCDRLGRRAKLYVDEEHTWERFVQRNLDAYRAARGEKSSGTGARTEADAARK